MMKSFKDFLFEMAFSKNKVEETISSMSLETVKHICKILASTNDTNKKHWIKEVYNYTLKSSRMKIKPKNKIPSYEQIKNWLFETSVESESDFKSIFNGVCWEENIETIYNSNIYKRYTEIQDKISNED